MDWIMQPLSGFANLDDPNLASDNLCTNGAVLNSSCSASSTLVVSCSCTGGMRSS